MNRRSLLTRAVAGFCASVGLPVSSGVRAEKAAPVAPWGIKPVTKAKLTEMPTEERQVWHSEEYTRAIEAPNKCRAQAA